MKTSECSIVEPWVGEEACRLKPVVCDDGPIIALMRLHFYVKSELLMKNNFVYVFRQ